MNRIFTKEIVNKVGEQVKLNGWVHATRKMGKMIFIDLRDVSGLVQVVFHSENPEALKLAKQLRPEFVIELVGQVNKRPDNLVNKEMITGTVEIEAKELKILSESKTPPFEIVETKKEDVGEELRYKYRYLDLRRANNQRKIILRSKALKFMRDFLHNEGFIEIETPILAKSTPEGLFSAF
jgi:aspartyl-tRNA synthetase